jgi:hypothetical protein
MGSFFKKYFLEGQKLTEKQESALQNLDKDAPFAERLVVKHRRLVSRVMTKIYLYGARGNCLLWIRKLDKVAAGYKVILF